MQAHIVATMSRHRGIIGAYSVVNERQTGMSANDWWYQQIGDEYLRIAFETARETDPTAILIYNQQRNETSAGDLYDLTRTDVDFLKSQGLVDVVGVEMHLGTNRPSKTDVITAMQSYGIPVWVTEFDSFQCLHCQIRRRSKPK
jgi:endo-1,4-beta-xylanase